MVHVSVKAETLTYLLGFPITNSMVLGWIVLLLFLGIGVYYRLQSAKARKSTFYYFLHAIFMAIYNLIKSVLHEKALLFYPLLAAYFFYIIANNWMGILPTAGSLLIKPSVVHEAQEASKDTLETTQAEVKEEGHSLIPLFRANTADLNTTFALALITVISIQYFGFRYNGLAYAKKFINVSSPILFFVGVLEIISELARVLSFSFRLFGNVLAGEILITIVAYLLPPATSFIMVPFFTLEIMAGAIQALVFTMLSTVLIGMATQKAHH